MTITPETVTHVAKLARLELTEEEQQRYTTELSKIIQLVDQLSGLDLEQASMGMALDASVQQTTFRKDQTKNEFSRDSLMENAPHKEEGFFRVPKILDDASK